MKIGVNVPRVRYASFQLKRSWVRISTRVRVAQYSGRVQIARWTAARYVGTGPCVSPGVSELCACRACVAGLLYQQLLLGVACVSVLLLI